MAKNGTKHLDFGFRMELSSARSRLSFGSVIVEISMAILWELFFLRRLKSKRFCDVSFFRTYNLNKTLYQEIVVVPRVP